MRIVVYTSVFPYPNDEGGKKSQFEFLKILVKEHEVHLIYYLTDDFNKSLLQDFEVALDGIRVHIIEEKNKKIAPKPLWVRLIEKVLWIAKRKNWYTTSNESFIDNQLFVNPIRLKSQLLITEFNRLLQLIKPDLVQIDFIDNSDLVLAVPDGVKKILILHDLRSVSVSQYASTVNTDKIYSKYLEQSVFIKESIFLKGYDGIICFNEKESTLLRQSGFERVTNIPFHVSIPDNSLRRAHKKVRKLVMIGPEHHYPNKDALIWFVNEVLPGIHVNDFPEIWVIGNWSQKTMQEFQKIPQIIFKGFQENLVDIFDDAVMIVPLRLGSGIRTKILDAFSLQVPVITTTVGVDGIPANHMQHCLIANDAESFAKMVEMAFSNEHLINEIRDNAFELIKTKFSPEDIFKKRLNFYQKTLLDLP